MELRSLAKRINNNIQEISALGVSSMKRHLYKRTSSPTSHVAINTKVGPVYLRPHDSDNIVMAKIFVEREYDLDRLAQGKSVRETYDRMVSSGKIPLIIDAGANIGLASRFFAIQYPQARVVAIEPDPQNCIIARKNTADFKNITVIEAAIGAQSGYVSLQSSNNESWATRTERADSGTAVVTIDDIRNQQNDFALLIVKIDIEGFESDLFSSNLDWTKDAPVILMEPHDWMLPGAGSSRTFQKAMMQGDREILILGENLVLMKSDV